MWRYINLVKILLLPLGKAMFSVWLCAHLLVAVIEISNAFNGVPRTVLISKILETELPPHYKKRLSNFLLGGQAFISYGRSTSKTRMFPNCVPQWAVFSPALFSLFLSNLPSQISLASTLPPIYADDLTIVSQQLSSSHNYYIHRDLRLHGGLRTYRLFAFTHVVFGLVFLGGWFSR